MTACSWPHCTTPASVEVASAEHYCRPHALHVADAAARNYVRERDRDTCQHCGREGGCEWAHVISRGARYVRHEPDNALMLCRNCHFHLTLHPAAFAVWVEETWPGRLERLMQREAAGERRGDSVDLAAVIRGFRERDLSPAEMERYKSGAWLG